MSVNCDLNFDIESQRFRLARPLKELGFGRGLYNYQWIVTLPAGDRKVLCGISSSLSRRISAYITDFNRDEAKRSKALHPLVRSLENRVTLSVVGPYEDTVDPKQLEMECIAQIPEEERLNATKGGNGGGAWDQYDDLPPSQGFFCPKETPKKYYPFKQKGDHIAPQLTPSAKISGVYKYKRIDEKQNENESQYIGMSTDVAQRTRFHASAASRHPESTKLARALFRSPEKFAVGIIPSTQGATPRTLRSAEKHYIEELRPKLNSNRGGGGPTMMRKRKAQEDVNLSLEEDYLVRPSKKQRQ